MVDVLAEEGDSILTTATTSTSTGRKMGKAKKAPVTKGRKTRTKQEEPVEVVEAPEPEDADFEVKVEHAPKPTRGRKRKSDELNQSTMSMVEVEAPPPKRRATRTRGSVAVDESILPEDAPTEAPKVKGRKGRPSKAKKNSTASVLPMDVDIPNDDEIDKALEADLERPLSDEEMPLQPPKQKRTTRGSKIIKGDHAMFGMEAVHIDEAAIEAELELMEEVELKPLPKAKGAPKGKTARKPSAKQQAAAAKKVADAEAAEAEAQAQAAEEEEEQRLAEQEASLQIVAELENSISVLHSSPIIQPKKQRANAKPTSRPAPIRATRGSVMSIDDHAEEHRDESGNETDASMASQSTVVRGGGARRGSALKKSKGGKKVVSRNIEEIIQKKPSPVEQDEEEIRHARKGKKSKPLQEIAIPDEDLDIPSPEIEMESEATPAVEMDEDEAELEPENEVTPPAPSSPLAAKTPSRPQIQQTLTAMMEYMDETHAAVSSKSKPAKGKSPMPPPRSPTPPPLEDTPSQSPQSSDAENHPPSSRPSVTTKKTPTPLSAAPQPTYASTPRTTTTRIPLASTPILSPSKCNIIAGLQSSEPWTAVDLDTIFSKSPSNQLGGFGEAVAKAKEGGLSSPEKKMTVEEWILYNANLAEEKLRGECEGMVGAFEQQGGRAMRALEGVQCAE